MKKENEVVTSLFQKNLLTSVIIPKLQFVSDSSSLNYRSASYADVSEFVDHVAESFDVVFQFFDPVHYRLFGGTFKDKFAQFVLSLHEQLEDRVWSVVAVIARGFFEEVYKEFSNVPERMFDANVLHEFVSKFDHVVEDDCYVFHQFPGSLHVDFQVDVESVKQQLNEMFKISFHRRFYVRSVDDVIQLMGARERAHVSHKFLSVGSDFVDTMFEESLNVSQDVFVDRFMTAVHYVFEDVGFYLGVSEAARPRLLRQVCDAFAELFYQFDVPMLHTVFKRFALGLEFSAFVVMKQFDSFENDVSHDVLVQTLRSHELLEVDDVDEHRCRVRFAGVPGFLIVPNNMFVSGSERGV